MEIDPGYAKDWLERELIRRRSANKSYSLRAFARQLEISPAQLSQILSDQRKISPKIALKCAYRLGLSGESRNKFLSSFRIMADGPESRSESYQRLDEDTFRMIADWHHYAILSLLRLKDFESNPLWIARRLGISSVEARSALQLLQRLGFLEAKDGRYVRSAGNLATSHDLKSAALRLSHVQNLKQAIESLDEVPSELRDVTSITMAIDLKRIPRAKKLIEEFRRKLSAYLEGGSKDEVFNLNVQLVPVTKVRKGKDQ